jgi:hypothetical protein
MKSTSIPHSSRPFQRYQEHDERHYGLRDLKDLKVANKTNKLLSLIDTIEPGLGSTLIIYYFQKCKNISKNI